MAKASGNTRIVRPANKSKEENREYYLSQIASGNIDASLSYFSERTGAFMLFMNGHEHSASHQDTEAELEVGRALADNDICVTLTPEGDGYEMYATHVKYNADGTTTYKYSEGTMSMFTYEQKTPTSIQDAAKASVRQAIVHANSKHSQIALIYDRYSLFHRQDIEEGMRYYQSKHHTWKEKGAKAVIVVNARKEVYEHHFDE